MHRRMLMQDLEEGVNPFQNAIAYYKLDSVATGLIDSVNGYNAPSPSILQSLDTSNFKVQASLLSNAFGSNIPDNELPYIPLSIYDNLNINNFTLGFWFYGNSTIPGSNIISDVGKTRNFNGAHMWLTFSFNQVNYIFNADGVRRKISTANNLSINTWYFVMIKHNTTLIELYLDDVKIGDYAPTTIPQTEQDISIGTRAFDIDFRMAGNIDELFIIDGKTDRATDALIYNNGKGTTI